MNTTTFLSWPRGASRMAVAVLATLSVCAAHAQLGAAQQDVAFNSGGFEQIAIPSQSCFGFMGLPEFRCEPVTVPAYLARAKDGNHKALVIISEGAGGLDKRHGEYARWLADHNINAVALDHFAPRHLAEAISDLQKSRDKGLSAVNMTLDMNAANLWFRDQADWKDAKFGYLGESMGGAAALNAILPWTIKYASTAMHRTPKNMDAVVALYPACVDRGSMDQRFAPIPLLIMSAEKDEITPAWTCEWQAKRMNEHGGNVTFQVLPGQHHDWDAPWRLHMAQGENTSKCTNTRVGDHLVLESNGKEYPATSAGERDLKNACRSRGFLDGNQGNWHTGYDVWTKFFTDKLLTSVN